MPKQIVKKESIQCNISMSPELLDLIKSIVGVDTHATVSDFIRDAIREKVTKYIPDWEARLYRSKGIFAEVKA